MSLARDNMKFLADVGCRFVLLRPHSKVPAGRLYTDGHYHHAVVGLDEARRHVRGGGNLGLQTRNVAVLDFDSEPAREALFEHLGPLPLHVRTGSGKHHAYIVGNPELPSRIFAGPDRVGEVKRQENEYVLVPPSVHPDTGLPYEWLAPIEPLHLLPPAWLAHLTAPPPGVSSSGDGWGGFELPDHIPEGQRNDTYFRWARSWKAQGVPLDEMLEHARNCNVAGFTDPPLPDHELEAIVRGAYHRADRPEFVR